MKIIYLTQGVVTVVDDRDYKDVAKLKWHAWWSEDTRSFYARRSIPGAKEFMARRIMGLRHGDKRQVDHIDHDTLNNQRKNLRICSHRGNHENMTNHSRYGVGVYFEPKCWKQYRARAKVEGKTVGIGSFDTPEEAQRARRKWLKERGLS